MSITGKNFRTSLGVVTVVAATALASGCSSSGAGTSTTAAVGGSSQSAAAGAPSASAAASSSSASSQGQGQSNADGGSTADASGPVLSGTALLAKLKAVKPAGYTVETDTESSSGATAGAPSYGHTMSACSNLTEANAGTVTVDYQASYAITSAYSNTSHDNEYVSYSSYRPGDAVKQMAEIAQLAEKCPSYSQPDEDGSTTDHYKVQLEYPTAYGDQEVDVRVTSTDKDGNNNELLLIRMGNEIITLSYGPFPGATIELSDLAHPYVLGS